MLPANEVQRLDGLHAYERAQWAVGHHHLGGVDEVGRGPLAGPVVAGCVVLSQPLMLRYLNDSKRVSEKRRLELSHQIRAGACAWGIGSASVEEIDRFNIAGATRLAMQRAVAACRVAPDALLVDAMHVPHFPGVQQAIIGGDALSAAIAAASIIAKVYRDTLLEALARDDARYGFEHHKGYGTKAHLEALRCHGPSEHHRRSFAPVRALLR